MFFLGLGLGLVRERLEDERWPWMRSCLNGLDGSHVGQLLRSRAING